MYKVPGSSGLVVVAANATGPGVSALLPFTFPRDQFLTGLLLVPRSIAAGGMTPAQILASLALNVTDENQEQVISDSRGGSFITSTNVRALIGVDGLELGGAAFRPFALQRPAQAQFRWQFQVQNRAASAITLAGIFLYTEEN